jgi:hypothetical protein
MRFQVEALEARWTPGGRGGIGGEVLPVHLEPRQAQVAPLVAYGSNSIRAGQEDNAPVAGIAIAVQKVRE